MISARTKPAHGPPEVPWLEIKFDKLFGGVNAKVLESSPSVTRDEFRSHFGSCLQDWDAMGKRGVWLDLPVAAAELVPEAIAQGFTYHHTTPSSLTLTTWLPYDEPSSLPEYPHHQVGVGGIVINKHNEILVIQEKRGITASLKDFYKLPGGLVDAREGIARAVCREVQEECGIRTRFRSIAAFRESPVGGPFGCTDLYVLCVLQVRPCVVHKGIG